MSDRPMHPPDRVTTAVLHKQSRLHRETIDEVATAVARDRVVVVGMGWNPHVKKARRILTAAGIEHTYLQYGNYLWAWRPRLAIKLWTGWPTFPQVFVAGTFVGGASDLQKALDDGTVAKLLEG